MEEHTKNPEGTLYTQKSRYLAFNLFFILIGIAGLLLVFWYSGPFYILVHSYGGNITASFAFYFIIRFAVARQGWKQVTSVCPRNTPLPYFTSAKTLKLPEKTSRTAPPRGFLGHELTSVLITILVTELFEATNGFFRIMTNVYDPLDYLANALGVALAVVIDAFDSYVLRMRKNRIGRNSDNHPHVPNNPNAA